jgi:ATP-dependent Clp protease ATP-binding subunit ClpC
MYERFTDRARKVMQLANQEAQRFNHEYIGTEHILLGLIQEGSGTGVNVLKNLDIDLRKVRREVEKIVQSGPDMVIRGKLPQTPRAKKVIEYALDEARRLNHNYVGTEHLLLGLLHETEGVAAQVLMNLGLSLEDARDEVLNILGHIPPDRPAVGAPPVSRGRSWTPMLDSFGADLSELARGGGLPPAAERPKEIERLLLVLGCHTARNALLVGPHGVGKSSLVLGLARLAVAATAPEPLRDRRIIRLSLRKLVLHAKDDSTKLMESVQAGANEARRAGDVLLFIPDLFSFGHDTRLVKVVLDAAEAQWIATATPTTHGSLVNDEVSGRNWQPVVVGPPSAEEAVAMLRALRPSYRDREQLEVRDDALVAAVELSERHLPDECLPGKAVRVLEQSIALLRLKQPPRPSAVGDIDRRIEQLQLEKEAAVADANFDRAASIRDQADRLKQERIRLLQEWQAAAQGAAGVVDAKLVEEIVSKLTGVQFRGSDAIQARREPGAL